MIFSENKPTADKNLRSTRILAKTIESNDSEFLENWVI